MIQNDPSNSSVGGKSWDIPPGFRDLRETPEKGG